MYQLVNNQDIYFKCNICGNISKRTLELLSEREHPSCDYCNSTLRNRAVIRSLSLGLFGKSIALKDFPQNKNICGLGMSEPPIYSAVLEDKFEFINTFYHKEPFLDVTSPKPDYIGKYDFIISSEIFEHVPPPVEKAFEGVFSMLKPGGFLILTVPYRVDINNTIEHFPNLFKWELREISEGKLSKKRTRLILQNETKEGKKEVFSDLIFHGGDGMTLEMRVFSKNSLIGHLLDSGFRGISFESTDDLEFGILFGNTTWSLPIIAYKPSFQSARYPD